MNSKEMLENLIHNFNFNNLETFFRSKSRTFKVIKESIETDKGDFTDGIKFGEFTTTDTDKHELVLYCFKVNKPLSERSGKKAQYDLAKKILKQEFRYSAGIFIFYDDKGDFRFSLIYDIPISATKRDWSNFRRFTYFVSKDQTNKTFLKQIGEGDFSTLESIKEAFSVEKVTKQFYQEIANWYFWALKNVKFPDDAEAEDNGRNIATIRLITRLIFIWFMKVRKLVPDELFDEDSLKSILKKFDLKNDNYYKAILQNLFFATLNTKQVDRRFTSKKKGYRGYSTDFGNPNVYRYEDEFLNSEEVIEKYFLPIPFLNGGLFECLDYKKSNIKDERKYIDGFTSTKSKQPVVPNYLFFADDDSTDLNKDYGTTNKKYTVRGLIKTLSLYNFTIDENDPNDADVALDPELLGKVFENLLASYNPETAKTARKSTGSYYTPRPIVDYMVDESLKQYFKTHIGLEEDERINKLFSDEEVNPFDEAETEKLVSLIDSLRAVDPAVGSGAFPMRLLNRLVFLLHKLDPDNQLWKKSQIDGIKKSVKDPILQRKFIEQVEKKFREKNPDYGRKLYLIEKCIYGVDIQQIAVEIAKLRFFISLLVDEKTSLITPLLAKERGWGEVENYGIEPLPNLDFKLMQGNSLISSFAGIDFNTKADEKDNIFTFDDRYKKLIAEFEELKSQYQNEPEVEAKRKLKDDIDKKLLEIFEEKLNQHFPQLKEINEKAATIKNEAQRKEYIEKEKKNLFKKIGIDLDQAEKDLIAYTEGRKQKNFFLWDVYFAEVFTEKGGFDIVIGNPPYVNVEQIDAFTKKNIKFFRTAYQKYDLYVLFYEKGIDLLKNNGQLIFITSNKFLSQGYGLMLRKEFLKYFICQIINFNYDIFESATVRTCIFHLKKSLGVSNDNIKIIDINTENDTYKFINFIYNYIDQRIFNEIEEYNFRINLTNEKIDILRKIRENTLEVEDICSVNYGLRPVSKIKDENKYTFIKKSNYSNNYKKYFEGKDMGKWLIQKNEFIDYKREKMYNAMFPELFENEKLVGLCTLSDIEKLRFNYDFENMYCNHSVAVLTLWYKFQNVENSTIQRTINKEKIENSKQFSYQYLQAILNSKLIKFYVAELLYDGTHFYPNHMKALPIKKADSKVQHKFISIVEDIYNELKQNPQANIIHLEDQIDIMVYKLYELTYEEAKIIDPNIEEIISKEGYEKYEIK